MLLLRAALQIIAKGRLNLSRRSEEKKPGNKQKSKHRDKVSQPRKHFKTEKNGEPKFAYFLALFLPQFTELSLRRFIFLDVVIRYGISVLVLLNRLLFFNRLCCHFGSIWNSLNCCGCCRLLCRRLLNLHLRHCQRESSTNCLHFRLMGNFAFSITFTCHCCFFHVYLGLDRLLLRFRCRNQCLQLLRYFIEGRLDRLWQVAQCHQLTLDVR